MIERPVRVFLQTYGAKLLVDAPAIELEVDGARRLRDDLIAELGGKGAGVARPRLAAKAPAKSKEASKE